MENVPRRDLPRRDVDAWQTHRVSDEIEAITALPRRDRRAGARRWFRHHPDDRGAVEREIAAALAAGRPFVLE